MDDNKRYEEAVHPDPPLSLPQYSVGLHIREKQVVVVDSEAAHNVSENGPVAEVVDLDEYRRSKAWQNRSKEWLKRILQAEREILDRKLW